MPIPILSAGQSGAGLWVVYCITAAVSLLLLMGYLCVPRKKDPWFLLMFSSVLVVNLGYLALALSQNLQQALLANRLAYLGSVFLPLSMWMIICRVSNLCCPKWVTGALLALAVVMFLLAASPGVLDIYYKEVTFRKVDGICVLDKVYGPAHPLYALYLLGYFAAMIGAIIYTGAAKRISSPAYAVILALSVAVNLSVWLTEKLLNNTFELLSVSYIISESFLLGLHLFMLEVERKAQTAPPAPVPAAPAADVSAEGIALFTAGLPLLTPKERAIYDCYVSGMTTAQIMEQLNIKENTLKFHNKNLYGKLGVSSRKQLLQIHRQLPSE